MGQVSRHGLTGFSAIKVSPELSSLLKLGVLFQAHVVVGRIQCLVLVRSCSLAVLSARDCCWLLKPHLCSLLDCALIGLLQMAVSLFKASGLVSHSTLLRRRQI